MFGHFNFTRALTSVSLISQFTISYTGYLTLVALKNSNPYIIAL